MREPGATERYNAADDEWCHIVAKARKKATGAYDNLDAETIAALASLVANEALFIDEMARLEREPLSRKRARGQKIAEDAEADLADSRELRALGDTEGMIALWGDEAQALAEAEGYLLDRSSVSFAALCNAINDAQIVGWEGVLERLRGNLVPTPEPLRLPPKATGSSQGGLSVTSLYDKYAAVPGRHPKTVAQWRPYIEHLVNFLGTDDVQAITHDDLVAWRNHLRDEVRYRGQPLSAKTINGSYLGAVSALFAWAKGDGLISQNPALEVTPVKLPAKPKTRGKAFTSEEAITILQASLARPMSREREDLRNAKRWCPWLMAYSGARVNGITQLRKEDIFQEDGIWVMRITPEAGTVKTKTFRLVPLHSHVLDQGFLDFVDGRAPGPLFYDPARRRVDDAINTQSKVLGTKLAAWVRSLGIEGVKPNHAWRHMFSNLAVRHGLDRVVAKAITGHASSDVHDKTYLEDLPNHVDVLARELEKMPRFRLSESN